MDPGGFRSVVAGDPSQRILVDPIEAKILDGAHPTTGHMLCPSGIGEVSREAWGVRSGRMPMPCPVGIHEFPQIVLGVLEVLLLGAHGLHVSPGPGPLPMHLVDGDLNRSPADFASAPRFSQGLRVSRPAERLSSTHFGTHGIHWEQEAILG